MTIVLLGILITLHIRTSFYGYVKIATVLARQSEKYLIPCVPRIVAFVYTDLEPQFFFFSVALSKPLKK